MAQRNEPPHYFGIEVNLPGTQEKVIGLAQNGAIGKFNVTFFRQCLPEDEVKRLDAANPGFQWMNVTLTFGDQASELRIRASVAERFRPSFASGVRKFFKTLSEYSQGAPITVQRHAFEDLIIHSAVIDLPWTFKYPTAPGLAGSKGIIRLKQPPSIQLIGHELAVKNELGKPQLAAQVIRGQLVLQNDQSKWLLPKKA